MASECGVDRNPLRMAVVVLPRDFSPQNTNSRQSWKSMLASGSQGKHVKMVSDKHARFYDKDHVSKAPDLTVR
jgi:hypothetical protein